MVPGKSSSLSFGEGVGVRLNMNKKISIQKILLYAALSIAAFTFIYPFIWMIGASFAPCNEVGTMTFWPATSHLG